jgi:pimeloyl-ACP methyl ester carboxylesterase
MRQLDNLFRRAADLRERASIVAPEPCDGGFVEVEDGVKLFVRDYPAQGAAKGAPVFCLHGLTRNSRDFDAVAPFMARQGRRVLAMDVRGRGRSDRDPQPLRYRADVYAKDVVLAMDRLGIESAVFVGTSMGGLITMILGVTASARVAAAVLNDVGPVINPAGLGRIMTYVGNIGPYESWSAIIEVIRNAQGGAFPRADARFWETFAHRVARERPDGKVEFDYDPRIREALLQPPPNPPPDMKAIFAALKPKPVLVLRAELSDILSVEGLAAMREIKPDLEFAEIPGIGHAPTLDEPEARRALSAFLSRAP